MEHNVGTTHLSLALSNYLSNKRLGKTAYVELNGTNQINCLRGRSKSNDRKDSIFTYMNIDFYPDSTLSALPSILDNSYRYVILDFGVLNSYTAGEYLRCDRKLAICASSLWKRPSLEAFSDKMDGLLTDFKNDIMYLDNLVEKKVYITRKKLEGHTFKPIPFISNPFLVTSETFDLFERIISNG